MTIAVAMLVPIGVALGIPMPTGLRLLSARAPHMIAWAWGMNGALSVLGATLAIFIAMNWGFSATLCAASATYLIGLVARSGRKIIGFDLTEVSPAPGGKDEWDANVGMRLLYKLIAWTFVSRGLRQARPGHPEDDHHQDPPERAHLAHGLPARPGRWTGRGGRARLCLAPH